MFYARLVDLCIWSPAVDWKFMFFHILCLLHAPPGNNIPEQTDNELAADNNKMNSRNFGFLIEFIFNGKLGCTGCWAWGNEWVWNNLFCLKFVYQYLHFSTLTTLEHTNKHWNKIFSKSPWMFNVDCWCFQLTHKAISYIIQLMNQHLSYVHGKESKKHALSQMQNQFTFISKLLDKFVVLKWGIWRIVEQ